MSDDSCVYLVGTGPGNPDLLTVRALRLIERADVVVYDRLVANGVLDLVPRGASRIYVGKATGRHTLPQDEINRLLVRAAARARLANPDYTLVVYMGVSNIDEISARLIDAGLPGDTPAAAIQDGATPQQRRLVTTLAHLGRRTREAALRPPVLFVIGRVVSMAKTLDWYQSEQTEARPAARARRA